MTELNYQELNAKIIDIINREPLNFSWIMSINPDSNGLIYEYDRAYIEYPCGWFKKLYMEFKIINSQADPEHFVYVLCAVKLKNLFQDYSISTSNINNHERIVNKLTEHAGIVLEKYKKKEEIFSLKFNRVVNKLIAKIK